MTTSETDRMAADDTLTRFAASGLDWRAESPSADIVRREVAERLDRLAEVPGAVVLKRNLIRVVWRVPLSDGRRVVVKRFSVDGVRDWLKYAVKDSRARTEWRIGRGLAAAGVPTAVPLAFGERRQGRVLRDAALVTREIEDAVHLNAYFEQHFAGDGPAPTRQRAALLRDIGRLVRQMHDAGFIHNDFHGGNVLVNGPPEHPSLHVIDLHSVARRTHPAEGARWFDLVKLLHSMLTCTTPGERKRICEAYEKAGGPSGTRIGRLLDDDGLTAAIEPELVAMERRRVRSRTDRSLARSSKFDVTQADGLRIHHLRTIDPEAVLDLIEPHLDALAAKAPNVLKDGTRSAVTRQTLAAQSAAAAPRVIAVSARTGPAKDVLSAARSVVVKQYRGRGLLDHAKNTVRTPRAVAAWVAGNGLLVRDFDAAEPLALVLQGRGPTLRDAWLVMEDLGDGTRVDLVALERWAGPLDAAALREKRDFLIASADLVRRLHASGVYHGDLKAVNLFVRGEPSEGRIAIADYDRVEFDQAVPVRRRIKNLAQLSASVPVCVSLADRLRFFRAYAYGSPDVAADWKRWFRRIMAECRRKIVVRMRPIE